MGQKSHPKGFRLALRKSWNSRWYEERLFASWLHEDLRLRREVEKALSNAGVSNVVIERSPNKVTLAIFTPRPGIVIGRKGSGIDSLKKLLQKLSKSEVLLDIHEVRKPELDPRLVAQSIAGQLERRSQYRRVIRKAIQTAIKFGATGIKVICSGRLGGGEMARCERQLEGSMPLHTLRAEIDYGSAEARTTYGIIGVKCWISRGIT